MPTTRPENERAFRKGKKNKGGRPMKLNDELIEKLVTFLSSGCYVETAAAACGINKKTFYEWLKIGAEKPKSIHGRLSNAVEVATAKAEISDLAAVSAATKKHWQAAAWRLQRRNPTRWAPAHRGQIQPEGERNEKTFRLNYNLDDDTDDVTSDLKEETE